MASLAAVLSITMALRPSVHSGTLVRADRHPRLWLAIPAITMVLLRVLKYVTRYVCEVTRYVIHVTCNLNYVTRFLS